jgi:hypothetical protein
MRQQGGPSACESDPAAPITPAKNTPEMAAPYGIEP